MKYNVPYEVTERQYKAVIKQCEGIIAHRICGEGKYWIKLWMPKYKNYVLQTLKNNS